MKRKIIILIGCALLAVQAIAQTENKKDDLTKEKKQTAINKEFINNSFQPIRVDTTLLLPELKKPKPTNTTTVSEQKIHNPFQPIEIDTILLLPELKELKTNDTTIVSKLEIQLPPYCDNKGIFPIHKKMFFYLENEQKQYLNLASYNLVYFALGLQHNNKLDLTGGLLVVKQFTNRSPYAVGRSGARFNLNYSITNQLDFNIWGQYLTDSFLNSPADVMLPQTGTGASMVLNLGGGSQFGINAEYQYDDKKKKWNYNSGGKLKLNF